MGNNQPSTKQAYGSLSKVLTEIFSQSFAAIGAPAELGKVVLSERKDLSDYQCNGALSAARDLKQNPRQIAQQIVDRVKSGDNKEIFSALSIDGPGFINISLSNKFLITQIDFLFNHKQIAPLPPEEQKYTIVDFGGPNVAKPMHVGHLRSTLLGDCLQRLCRFLGLKVVSDIHLGDWGTPMGMLITEVKRQFPDLPYFKADYAGPYPEESPVTIEDLEKLYPQAANRCNANKEDMAEALHATTELQNGKPYAKALWQHFVNVSIKALKEDFAELDVYFDLWNGEASVHHRIAKILEKLKKDGHATISDGALIIPINAADEKKKSHPSF